MLYDCAGEYFRGISELSLVIGSRVVAAVVCISEGHELNVVCITPMLTAL